MSEDGRGERAGKSGREGNEANGEQGNLVVLGLGVVAGAVVFA
jgi:hypothetical protein